MRNGDRGEGVGNQSQEKGRGRVLSGSCLPICLTRESDNPIPSHPLPHISNSHSLFPFSPLFPARERIVTEAERHKKKRKRQKQSSVCVWVYVTNSYTCLFTKKSHTHACLTALFTLLHLLWGPFPAQFY